MPGRAVCILAAAAILLAACGRQPPEHPIVEAEGQQVRIARSEVMDGEVHFYTFRHQGKRVNFLVRTDGEGRLQTHLDACYGCYRYRRGFFVEGEFLVCRACRFEYALDDEMWDFRGAGAPLSIHSRLEGEELIIDQEILEKAARYF